MKTNRQKSFIATLELPTRNLDVLGLLHGTPATRLDYSFSGGFFSGGPQRYDDSHLLGHVARPSGSDFEHMKIYFRCTDDYYHLYIRTHETYHGYCVSQNADGFLGAFAPAGRDTTSFNLLSLDKRIITLNDMTGDVQYVRLQGRNSKHIGARLRRNAPYHYLGRVEEDGLIFRLKIIERNAAYLSDPDEV